MGWIRYPLVLVAMTAAACSALPRSAPQDPLAMRPEEVVESFYNWVLSYPGNPLVDRAYRAHPLLDERYVALLDAMLENGHLAFSPLLCAQDVPTDIDAHPATIDGETARVPVTTSFPGHAFEVELMRREGEWRITHIHCVPPGG